MQTQEQHKPGYRVSYSYDYDYDEDWFEYSPESTDEATFDRKAALNGLKLRVRSQAFRGGRVTAVMSGVTLDLRDAALSPEGATIDVQSALSGIDILVPPDWDITCDVDAVFGGVDGGRGASRSASAGPRLWVRGTVIAGGLCVR